MVKTQDPNTTILSSEPRYIETPEFRRLTYKMFRMPYGGGGREAGRPRRLPAWRAWELTRRYVEALR
jgi:hypothetical protein